MIFLSFFRQTFFIFFILLQINFAANAQSSFVVARVNNRVITFSDLQDRYNFVILESKIKINSKEEKLLLLNQIIDKMVDEKLILQEASKLNINVDDAEMEGVLESIAQKRKTNIAGLKNIFAAKKLSFEAYKEQIKADIAWSQIIANSVRSRIKITDSQIKEFLEQKKLNTDIAKFFIAEIFIPNEKDANLLANKLVAELRRGANFKTIVKQFSRSPTAENDGEIGWVLQSDVEPKVYSALNNIAKNEYCDPLLLGDGYYIFKLLDKKLVTELKENDANEARKKIFTKELEIESKSYLIDLRKGSFIEVDRKNALDLLSKNTK